MMIGVTCAPRLTHKVVELLLSAANAEKLVTQRAQVSENVITGDHARKRMAERDIYIDNVFQVLRTGSVDDAPIRTDHGEWQCKMVKRIRGTRAAGVVTIIFHKEKLFQKTVEWEDL